MVEAWHHRLWHAHLDGLCRKYLHGRARLVPTVGGCALKHIFFFCNAERPAPNGHTRPLKRQPRLANGGRNDRSDDYNAHNSVEPLALTPLARPEDGLRWDADVGLQTTASWPQKVGHDHSNGYSIPRIFTLQFFIMVRCSAVPFTEPDRAVLIFYAEPYRTAGFCVVEMRTPSHGTTPRRTIREKAQQLSAPHRTL